MKDEDRVPPHVSIVFGEELRITASTQEIRTRLDVLGSSTSRDRYGLNVRFEAGDDHLSNAWLIKLLQDLSQIGVAFSHDFKQIVSPASHIDMLIKRGVEFKRRDHARSTGTAGRHKTTRGARTDGE